MNTIGIAVVALVAPCAILVPHAIGGASPRRATLSAITGSGSCLQAPVTERPVVLPPVTVRGAGHAG
jgi:hypothetical protein